MVGSSFWIESGTYHFVKDRLIISRSAVLIGGKAPLNSLDGMESKRQVDAFDEENKCVRLNGLNMFQALELFLVFFGAMINWHWLKERDDAF